MRVNNEMSQNRMLNGLKIDDRKWRINPDDSLINLLKKSWIGFSIVLFNFHGEWKSASREKKHEPFDFMLLARTWKRALNGKF